VSPASNFAPHRGSDRHLADSIRRVGFTGDPLEVRDSATAIAGMDAALSGITPGRTQKMSTIDLDTLTQVTGGAVISSSNSSNAALTQSLTAIQSSISSLTNNNNNNQNNLLLPMAMMMAMNRRQSSVVSAGGATVVSPG
jgi:hypothetical protein